MHQWEFILQLKCWYLDETHCKAIKTVCLKMVRCYCVIECDGNIGIWYCLITNYAPLNQYIVDALCYSLWNTWTKAIHSNGRMFFHLFIMFSQSLFNQESVLEYQVLLNCVSVYSEEKNCILLRLAAKRYLVWVFCYLNALHLYFFFSHSSFMPLPSVKWKHM